MLTLKIMIEMTCNIKIGTINYATHSGLGILVKEFYDNGVINDILVVEHFKYTNYHTEWYPNSKVIKYNNIDNNTIEEFIKSIDILFLFETPFSDQVIPLAKTHNKPIVMMPMYEWSSFPLDVDLFIVPSQLDYDYYKQMYPDHRIVLLPVPSNSNIKWKLKEKALTFMHNGGNGSHYDRNGTLSLIEALPYIKSNCKIKIKAQKLNLPPINDHRVELINENLPFDKLWEDVDVFIFPERFNGLSLPLQEAHAAGCLVIAGDREPINTWLPNKPLISPIGYNEYSFIPNIPFKSAIYDPKDIAAKIDEFYNTDITYYSLMGKNWSKSNSWDVLKFRYLDLIYSLKK